ncbi:zinc ABC transporter substrate-binding protein [Candidatus Uhrbacteria bacterium]|nr:zinc ABC transporter substrate-binding protein [Candidatus Uhrbacteria bacterium]
MKPFLSIIGLIGALFVATFLFAYGSWNFRTSSDRVESLPVVSASIFALSDIVSQVGAGVVEVQTLLPPGSSPHTFEPSPETIKTIERSPAVFLIGHGLDTWALSLIGDSKKAVIVDRDIELRASADTEDDGPVDPHYWLVASNASLIAQTVSDRLIELFPHKQTDIIANTEAYQKKLEDLESRLQNRLAPFKGKKIITFHDAWYYFSEAYGLDLIATFEPTAGREPTARSLAKLSKQLDLWNIRVLFAEPQFSIEPLKGFLTDHHARVEYLDPAEGESHPTSYIDIMDANARILSENL